MSVSPQPATRRLLHRRAIDVQVFAREDGQFDVEAQLTDVKTHDVPLGGLTRHAGDPIHDMRLDVTVDQQLTITAASSETRAMPYPGACGEHGQAYGQLVGLNLMRGFRQGVKERLSGTLGCTHLTELSLVLPTAVIQAFANSVIDPREAQANGQQPQQLDRCHALRSDGQTVALHYPRWHRPAEPVSSSS